MGLCTIPYSFRCNASDILPAASQFVQLFWKSPFYFFMKMLAKLHNVNLLSLVFPQSESLIFLTHCSSSRR
jgi:hypothetical protein